MEKNEILDLNFIDVEDIIGNDYRSAVDFERFNSYDEFLESYGGKVEHVDLEELPKGSDVIVVDSLEQLDTLISGLSSTNSGDVYLGDQTFSSNAKVEGNMTYSGCQNSGSGTISERMYGASWSWEARLYASYVSCYDNPNRYTLLNVSAYTGLSGFTLGVDWDEINATSYQINDQRWNVSGSGTYSLVIFHEGIGTVYSDTVSHSFDVYY